MIRKIRSKYSGVLEITYDRGQKVLDSRNTSYSYGNLQRVWDKVLQRIRIKDVSRTLILGMGAGSSIQLLREKYNYDRKIVAVELDPVIVEIARDEFGIRPDNNLRIET
ncbi:MAG: spermine synthase, partial [Bacteroidia bacterium]|nr:spermine synthase [Bacteroidia bacterium]